MWQARTADRGVEGKLASLLRAGHLTQGSVIVHELDTMEARLGELRAAFPPDTIHAMAIKANPVLGVLKPLVKAGAGLEAASAGELALGLAAGCPPERLVLDSPCKTEGELREALRLGVRINANSVAELERIERLGPQGPIGLRLNPVVAEADRESPTMVATLRSKFGLPEHVARQALQDRPWVNGLHIHVGSQVATLDDLSLAAGRVLELARSLPSIRWIDIGGGLPTRYHEDDPGLDPDVYAQALQRDVPELFHYPLITEVGRALQAGCGWAASRVEYASDGKVIIHLGADFALREAYQPQSWYHEITVHDSEGRRKEGAPEPVDVYGPLCFFGDQLATGRALPHIEPGDILVLHDTGGYTLSMWSRYCSRQIPAVLGWTGRDWLTLRRAETPQDLVSFWGLQD
jgi:diaminopimelate decarboxylase